MRFALALVVLALVGCRSPDAGVPIEARADTRAELPASGYKIASLRVIDGDTFEADGETIRIANIDTPEKAARAKCQAEAALAEVAARELEALLGLDFDPASGRGILPVIEREGQDRYGRTLARVQLVTGGDAGEEMVRRGVAVRWTGRRAEWCEDTRSS